MYLAWYSPEAIAAATPSGILNFTLMSIFIGTASYVGTFVAQYYGAGMYQRIGHAIWQAFYVSLMGALILLAFIPLAGPIFTFIGHDVQVRRYEIEYFQLLCLAGFPVIATAALGSAFTSLGRPWTVMGINALTTLVSLVCGYLLIFGNWGLPEMGIRGAAYACIISCIFSLFCYAVLMIRRSDTEKFHMLKGYRLDRELLFRLVRYGFPSGIQFALEMAGITFFVLLIGRLGTISLAATNIALNINMLAVMPMIGSGFAVSVLTARYIGMNRPDLAQKSTYSGLHIALLYFTMVAVIYFFFPGPLLEAFTSRDQPERFAEVSALTIVLLRFVALYSLFNAMSIIFAAALKGAGDTHFVLRINVLFAFLVAVPTYIVVIHLHSGITTCWGIATTYSILISIVFMMRFVSGDWKKLRIIECREPEVPPEMNESSVTGRI
jgi:MATE family multidrug resistance protein